jgi:hypothetical protein
MTSALVNTCTRPVELHLTSGVVVVPALSTIDCTADDLALAQVQALFRSGVLALRPAPEPQPPAEPAATRDEPGAADPSESTVEHPARKRLSKKTAQS